ncbi:MAG: response regulator, partial [Candidatus Omnitrophica bacterium]|nr:response regulator [Candidatus Omnitrophota bacterium]
PEDVARVMENNRRRMEGEEISRVYEFRAVRKDGAVIEIEGSFDLIRRGEQVIGIQGIFRDITERKRIQESLFEQQKEQTIITLAGGIAHDFNNILLGVMGNAALLEDELAGLPSAKSLVKNILTSSARMAELTNQLLAYARGGKHRPEPSSVNEIIEDTLKILHGSLHSSVRVERHLDPAIWPVEADRTQMSQVFLNLFVNALEAMDMGGTLTVRTENVRHATLWHGPGAEQMAAGDYVHIAVTDTGVGMTEETRRRLFEPFYTTKFMGRGLGLAASQGIIYNHRGVIVVDSEQGRGSTFHVILPKSERCLATQSAPSPAATRHNGTILVVDDEETVRDVAGRMLKRLGFQVLLAEDGAAGLALHEQNRSKISLVLLDIQMDGMSGDEVFERMIEIDPEVRVILSSGYEETAVTTTFRCSEKIAGFIQKPYTMATLTRTIDEVLGE